MESVRVDTGRTVVSPRGPAGCLARGPTQEAVGG